MTFRRATIFELSNLLSGHLEFQTKKKQLILKHITSDLQRIASDRINHNSLER